MREGRSASEPFADRVTFSKEWLPWRVQDDAVVGATGLLTIALKGRTGKSPATLLVRCAHAPTSGSRHMPEHAHLHDDTPHLAYILPVPHWRVCPHRLGLGWRTAARLGHASRLAPGTERSGESSRTTAARCSTTTPTRRRQQPQQPQQPQQQQQQQQRCWRTAARLSIRALRRLRARPLPPTRQVRSCCC